MERQFHGELEAVDGTQPILDGSASYGACRASSRYAEKTYIPDLEIGDHICAITPDAVGLLKIKANESSYLTVDLTVWKSL